MSGKVRRGGWGGIWGAAPPFGGGRALFWGVLGVFWVVFFSSALFWRMEELGDALRSHHNIEDFASLLLPAQVLGGGLDLGSLGGGGRCGVSTRRNLGFIWGSFGVSMGQT